VPSSRSLWGTSGPHPLLGGNVTRLQWRLGLGRSCDVFRREWVLEPTRPRSAATSAKSCILGPGRSYPIQAPRPFKHPSMEETVKQCHGGCGRYSSSCRNGCYEVDLAPRE
jgi:hypothetical protein